MIEIPQYLNEETRRLFYDEPAWYRLDTDGTKIVLYIHKLSLPIIQKYFSRFGEMGKEMLQSGNEFIPPSFDHEWGFGLTISKLQDDQEKDWVVCQCDLPVPSSPKKRIINYSKIQDASMSFSVIFRTLFTFFPMFGSETNSRFPQMLEAYVNHGGGPTIFRSCLFSLFRPVFVKWLNENFDKKEELEKEILRIMMSSDETLTGYPVSSISKRDFEVNIQDPRNIALSCPGNACGLYTDEDRLYDDENNPIVSENLGFKASTHNADSAIQQLVLLSGIAKLYSFAYEDFVKGIAK